MYNDTELSSVERLKKDIRQAASTLSDTEARFLVDAYYQMQDDRIRADGQVRSMENEPHAVLSCQSGALPAWIPPASGRREPSVRITLPLKPCAGSWARALSKYQGRKTPSTVSYIKNVKPKRAPRTNAGSSLIRPSRSLRSSR